jgi:hypothetical protein
MCMTWRDSVYAATSLLVLDKYLYLQTLLSSVPNCVLQSQSHGNNYVSDLISFNSKTTRENIMSILFYSGQQTVTVSAR